MKELAASTGVLASDLERLIKTAPIRYKVYSIPKKRGRGSRTIAQPSREIKALQRMIVQNQLRNLPIHDAAHGYVSGRGIRTNALKHVDSRYLVKCDFANFFPSITSGDFRVHLSRYLPNQFSEVEVQQLLHILFWRPRGRTELHLSIGAPSSPFISNTIMFPLDSTLSAIAMSLGATYTRYADDLTFSTSEAHSMDSLSTLLREALGNAEYPRIGLNERKCIFASKRGRRVVTGVVIASHGELSLGRRRKREIRAMAHKESLGRLSQADSKKLQGLLSFATDLEPEFAANVRERYAAH